MKLHELESLVTPHTAAVAAICTDHGVDLAKLSCCSATNRKEAAAGIVGRVTLVLADDAPGWRNKDNSEGRYRLRKAVREYLTSHELHLTVRLQASYSELAEQDGVIVRRDANGDVTGAYEL